MRAKALYSCIAIFVILAAAAPWAEGSQCKATKGLAEREMNPEGIFQWLNRSPEVRQIGDLLCCLPEIYRRNFLIGHLSIAGQNGSPESPRIIMHPSPPIIGGTPRTDTLILSVNGGAGYLNQTDSFELAFYKAKERTLDYFDLSLEHSRPTLTKNPESCMQCHGDGGAVPKAGPRPIFAQFGHWPRFVGGASPCTKEEDAIQEVTQKAALKALATNPRFRCLDQAGVREALQRSAFDVPGPASVARSEVGGEESMNRFDHFIFSLSSERVARLIRETPDFEAYKYMAVATHRPDCDVEDLESWIPPEVLARHSDLSFVSAEVLAAIRSGSPDELLKSKTKAAEEARGWSRKELSQIGALLQGGFHPTEDPLVCRNDTNAGVIRNFLIRPKLSDNPVLWAYTADSRLKQAAKVLRGHTSPVLRFLFEGRGIDMNHWGADVTPGDGMITADFASELLRLEPAGSRLRAILESQPASAGDDMSKHYLRICEALKHESWKALGGSRKE